MRRQGQHYHQADQMRHAPSQRIDPKSGSGNFQRREQGLASERGHDYANARDEEQWRSGKDGSNMSNPHQLHRDDLEKLIYQDQRSDFQSSFGSQGNRFHPRQEGLEIQFADDSMMARGFDSLENKFLNDIMKLVSEQKNAEDAEYTRHKEKLDTINIQYEEQLTTQRVNQASRRDVILQNESNARQQQYQQLMSDQYSNYSIPSNNPHIYNEASSASASTRYAHRQHDTTSTCNNKTKDSYKYNQRSHFSAGSEEHHGPESQNSYHSGRIYDNNRGFH
ncbi:unnamed protein product [Rhodiola kirilowii]